MLFSRNISYNLVAIASFVLLSSAFVRSSVIDLSESTPDAFKSELDSMDVALVKFYAPWCGHCKRLAPAFEEAAKILAADDTPVPLVKVDCTNDKGGKDICGQNDVNGYPTVKIYRGGKSEDYNDGRDVDSIVRKMRSLAGPATKQVDSFAKLDELYKNAKNLVVFGLFESADDSLYQTFIDTAKANRDLASYVHIFKASASDSVDKLTTLNAKKDIKLPTIVLARPAIYRSKFEPDYLIYSAEDELNVWIKSNAHGLVIARSPSDAAIPKPHVIVYYNVDYERDPKGTNYWRNRVLKVANKFKDEDVKFAISSISQFAGELSEFGMDMASLPKDNSPAVVAKDREGKKYSLKEKFSVDSFEKFVQSLLDGKLEPFLKSEDEPDNTDAGVKVAVAKNFDQLVINSEKDIFIEFYAPWCGHCKSLAPAWDELGNKLKAESGVDIVKIDATANDFPNDVFTVHGFPTLYWFPKDSKTPVKYEGARDVDALLKYVAQHATDELKSFDRDGQEKADSKDEL